MSATLDAQKISDFFGGCPTLHVPGRTFPVEARFLEDSIEYAGWSIKEGSPYAKRRESSPRVILTSVAVGISPCFQSGINFTVPARIRWTGMKTLPTWKKMTKL